MRQQNKDLFLILILAVINMVCACFSPHLAVMSIILALPLVFLVPGYLLLELLVQKREHDGTMHLLLSIGLSLSIEILGGFLLNIVPVGLTTLTWGLFLGALTIPCLLLCMVKRCRWQIHKDQKKRDLPTFCGFLLLTLTICVVIFAFMYTNNTIVGKKYQGFTKFWLLLGNQQTHICTVRLGIDSSETVTTTYQVEVKENNRYVAHWSSITLAPQDKWGGQLPIAINRAQTTSLPIEADLYREQEPASVYRTVQLLLSSSEKMCTQDL